MPVDPDTQPGDAIAIVGIGGVFAASESPDRLWANVLAGADATRDVPPGRWLVDPADALDPRIAQPDRVYTTRGGFVGPIRFDPTGTALDPALVERLDPAFHLALVAAGQAWRDARDGRDRPPPRRRGVRPHRAADRDGLDDVARSAGQGVRGTARIPTAGSGDPRPTSGRAEPFEPRNAFPAGLPAAIVAEAFGLGGVAYTLDAACASSLYALKLAVDELRSGRADAMIAGGVSRPDALYTQMGFSQLRRSRPEARPRRSIIAPTA